MNARETRGSLVAGSSVPGSVIEVLPKLLYRVRLEGGEIVTAGLSSTLRHAVSRLIVGDQVLLRISANDPHRGSISRKTT